MVSFPIGTPDVGGKDPEDDVGFIYPPADVRGVIDKTAQFVARCGPVFEERILRQQDDFKFAFLRHGNPYRPYYEHKVKQLQSGNVEETKPEVPEAVLEQKRKEEEKKEGKRRQQQKMLTEGEKAKEVKPPRPDEWSILHPHITPLDMDIIKATAQFVSRNGQKFLIGLTQRESRNPQYDFLKPTHALFGYFTALVDSYTRCLIPSQESLETLRHYAENPGDILNTVMGRFAWDWLEEAKRISKEEEERQEKEVMGHIDWHDFVIVETIEFTEEDEKTLLPAPVDFSTGMPQGPPQPLTQEAVQLPVQEDASKAEAEKEQEEREKERERRVREDREREDREREAEAEKEREEERERLERLEREEREREEAEADRAPVAEIEEEISIPVADAEMKIRKDYVRHRRAATARLMQRCPITGQLIPAEEMSGHLKVLLLDPKWKQQKDALVERARKESAFADDVEANLAGFVAKRPDLFGSVDQEIQEAAEAGAEASAREAGADAGPAHANAALMANKAEFALPAVPSEQDSANKRMRLM